MVRGGGDTSRLFTTVACLHYIFLYPRIPRLQYPRPALHAKSDNITAPLWFLIDFCVPHQSAFAMDRRVWDPIRVCGMSDPDCTTTCCGKTRANVNCKNRISRQSCTDAAHLLQLRAQRPADDSLLESLRKIARLLLCKRNHQHKEDEQVQPLAMRWYQSARASRVVGRHAWNPGMESRQSDSPLYPELDLVDLTSTPLTPMDVEPAAAEPQSIRM
ncbi:hypothetical protein BJX99DRAFT_242931, partial [Aspergillus californicus]